MVVFFIDGFYFVLLHKSTSVEANELTDEVTKVYSVSISNINRMLLSGEQIGDDVCFGNEIACSDLDCLDCIVSDKFISRIASDVQHLLQLFNGDYIGVVLEDFIHCRYCIGYKHLQNPFLYGSNGCLGEVL